MWSQQWTGRRPVKNAHLDDAPNNAGNVRDGTCVAGAEPCGVKHGGRDEEQNEAPKWFHDIEKGALCRGEAEANDNEWHLLRRVVGKLIEEHMEAETNERVQ